jgi:hypothetical protein
MTKSTRIIIVVVSIAAIVYLIAQGRKSIKTVPSNIPIGNTSYTSPTKVNTNPITGIFDTIGDAGRTIQGIFG